jgi:TRAP transporter TAXI family solute receptor
MLGIPNNSFKNKGGNMKKISMFLVASLLVVAGFGCSSQSTTTDTNTSTPAPSNSGNSSSNTSTPATPAPSKPDNFTITMPTGTTTGTYYPLGAILTDFWSKKLDYIKASSQASNGSVQNLNFIKQGEAQVSLTPIGTLYQAVNGEQSFEGNKVENVTILAGLYPNVNHLVARKGSGVETIADIAGKSFVPGATGSATELESRNTLWAYDVDYEKVNKNFVGFTEATDLMRNKQVDAAMVMAGVPTSAVTEMLATADGQLLSYSDEAIAKLQEKFPWTADYTIKAGSYENQAEDVKTVAQFNFLVAHKDIPEDVAYDLVKSFWENLSELEGSHAVVKQFDVQNALKGAGDIPIHPGAAKYYKEVGVLK